MGQGTPTRHPTWPKLKTEVVCRPAGKRRVQRPPRPQWRMLQLALPPTVAACSTSYHGRSRILGRLSPRPLNLFQPGWFQGRRLLHHGQARSRVWLQPLSGPDPPTGQLHFCTKMRIGALPTPTGSSPEARHLLATVRRGASRTACTGSRTWPFGKTRAGADRPRAPQSVPEAHGVQPASAGQSRPGWLSAAARPAAIPPTWSKCRASPNLAVVLCDSSNGTEPTP